MYFATVFVSTGPNSKQKNVS